MGLKYKILEITLREKGNIFYPIAFLSGELVATPLKQHLF